MTGLVPLQRRIMRRLGVVLALVMGAAPLSGAEPDLDAPPEVVEFADGDTLRGIVERYLSDPDLWPTVLRLNDIASPADLVPGMQLQSMESVSHDR